jgi:hypothetical protein
VDAEVEEEAPASAQRALEAHLRIQPGAEEVGAEVLGEVGGDGFQVGGGLEDGEVGEGLAVDVAGFEDLRDLAGQLADLGDPSPRSGRL